MSKKTPAALILASGFSHRMGKPKALMKWDESTTFLEKLIWEYLDAGCNPVVCTVNERIHPHCKKLERISNVRLLCNHHPERGRMYSIRLGLEAVKKGPFCLLQNVDNPFINSDIIRAILKSADHEQWCSPEYKGKGGHPVVLPKKIIDQILQLKNEEITLRTILDSFPKKVVEMDDGFILRNINTPEEYQEFREGKTKAIE